MIMRGRQIVLLLALVLMSCSKEGLRHSGRPSGIDYYYGSDLRHEKIVLGERLENPYKTENMSKAFASLYPTKADRVEIKTTNLYVRFLPADEQQYERLQEMGVEMLDHPMDYSITVDGDWYHDPEIPETDVTWQYAVVPAGFDFPDDIRHEVIHECYLAENDPQTRSLDQDIDWQAVEREAYFLTGNADRIHEPSTKAAAKVKPSGRITIVDEHANGGKPFGVAGVMVSCNSFVKFATSYTDRDGYYSMSKEFSSDLRYRLVFKNERNFSIGFNLVLLPASVSTLGKSGPEGVNMTVSKDSEDKLFRRCVVNNAAYDYIGRCASSDLGLSDPPADLRFWIMHGMEASSAVMLHHGAIVRSDYLEKYLGSFSSLIEYFLPDITIGAKGKDEYRDIYSTTCHELAHASHFSKVGTEYWNRYILYIIESFIRTGGMTYGDGTASGAGYCEIGEMWAYYLESRFYKDRYGGNFPTFGTSYWFYPQIFRSLDERGFTPAEMLAVLKPEVTSKSDLKSALILACPEKRTIIEQVFSRY